MNSLEQTYYELNEKINNYIADRISAVDLKHESVLLGIYQQRNDLFMMRIRVTGGHISVKQIIQIADIMEMHNVGFTHITSRQDLQLQDVPPTAIYLILKKLTANDMPFRGGGGNTYRNILVSTETGISKNDAFDVLPHAKALNEFLFHYDKAFKLPRKLKIGFSSGPDDSIKVLVQDLGFMAKLKNGEKGFEVYVGGGMGKETIFGVKLFDFLPEKQFAKCAKAVTDLFYDHGNRNNRNQARLRFVLKRLGKENFIALCKEYFDKTEEIEVEIDNTFIPEEKVTSLHRFESVITKSSNYSDWTEYAVSQTCFGDDIISLRLFIPYGNLNIEHLRKIALLADKCGLPFIRLTQSQDILFPLIHKSALPMIFEYLTDNLKDSDLLMQSFKGHIISCIGAKVCKIGIADSPALSDQIAETLDEYFKYNPEKRTKSVLPILRKIKISGCPNACSGHAVSKIGLQGMKKRIDDILTEGALLYTNGKTCQNEACLAASNNRFLSKNDISQEVMNRITAY